MRIAVEPETVQREQREDFKYLLFCSFDVYVFKKKTTVFHQLSRHLIL